MKDVNGMKYTVFGLTNLVEIADHFSVSPGRNHLARGNVFERGLHRKAFRAAYVYPTEHFMSSLLFIDQDKMVM